jgi:antitoxin (DNA-binding transcriptional repressor) of toxin-antitoxin stability system
MKTISARDLNRRTARILDAVESGENFELRRNGKAVAYLTQKAPPIEGKPDWKAHFDSLRQEKTKGKRSNLLRKFEEERRRLKGRELALGNL